MITWFTGNTGSGKTTAAQKLKAILLDGDELRRIWPGLSLNKQDRWEQSLRTARLATNLEKQGHDIAVAVIAPYRELRKEIWKICKCKFVYMTKKEGTLEYPYEPRIKGSK